MQFVQIRILWQRWIEVLTLAWFAWREAQRARQALTVAYERGHFVVRESPGTPEADTVAIVAPGEAAPEEVIQAVRNGLVVFELPAEVVVARRIAVPAQAREFLAGIVRNQIERLSPWYVDEVVFGFDAEANAEDPASLDVRVFIALRAAIEEACHDLDVLGLQVDRIVTRPPPPRVPPPDPASAPAPAMPVALWSRLADASPENLAGLCRQVGAAIAATVVVSFGVSVWAMTSASSLGTESEEVTARMRTLQRQIQGPAQMSTLNPRERAWYAKETSPTAAILIEALSRSLPDGAYLTELRLEQGGTVRLIGLTNDAPSLIAPLERSGHLSDVHFFAPTTRGPDGSLFRFSIEARVEPHFRMAEASQ